MEDLKPSAFTGSLQNLSSRTPEDTAQAVNELYNYVIAQAKKAINWYYVKRQPKRFWGLILRYGSIVFIAMAGILPIIITIFKDCEINPAWSAVSVALAALMIAIDRFGGYTTGWIRYVVAAQKLDQALEDFRFTWESKKYSLAGSTASPAETQALVNDCKVFLQLIQSIIEDETQKWVSEFQSALNDIETSARVAAETAKTTVKAREDGALSIIVSNGGLCDLPWSVSFPGGVASEHSGSSAALTNLKPGIVAVKVKGIIKGQMVQEEMPVLIKGGEITKVTMTLS
jgi:hypothetical protein